MKNIYPIFIELMIFGMKVFSLFNSKAKKGVLGRTQSFSLVRAAFSKEDKIIWMHAASLGEYEQGLPVVEKLHSLYPAYKVLITFFSPSGYEIVSKSQNIADVVCYLPWDRKKDIQQFVEGMNVSFFFTVKYDYWFQLLSSLKAKNTKTFVISSQFHKNQIFFQWYGDYFRNSIIKNIDWFFHQTQQSADLALSIGVTQSSVSGDTRYDRVRHLAKHPVLLKKIEHFCQSKNTIIFGSSWEIEEKIAVELSTLHPNCRFIIAPHDIKRVPELLKKFKNAFTYSTMDVWDGKASVLIIDSIGMLSQIYRYTSIAVIGGGFGVSGLHNILEAAVHGVPTLFGNNYKNHPEADLLLKEKGSKSFGKYQELVSFCSLLISNPKIRQTYGMAAKTSIMRQPNSTQLIINKIKSLN